MVILLLMVKVVVMAGNAAYVGCNGGGGDVGRAAID